MGPTTRSPSRDATGQPFAVRRSCGSAIGEGPAGRSAGPSESAVRRNHPDGAGEYLTPRRHLPRRRSSSARVGLRRSGLSQDSAGRNATTNDDERRQRYGRLRRAFRRHLAGHEGGKTSPCAVRPHRSARRRLGLCSDLELSGRTRRSPRRPACASWVRADTGDVAAHEVDEYLAGLDEPKRSTLLRLRTAILEVVPDAEQGLSYGAPAFKVLGKTVAGFAGLRAPPEHAPQRVRPRRTRRGRHRLRDIQGSAQVPRRRTTPPTLGEEACSRWHPGGEHLDVDAVDGQAEGPAGGAPSRLEK